MTQRSINEQHYLHQITKRLSDLRTFLNATSVEEGDETVVWFKYLARMKAIQGNTSNDLSFVACLLAKEYLATRFQIRDHDVALKPQGAPGLDIDMPLVDGKRIVGEIKTTVPYSGAKNDLGAKQKETFRHDFDKLNRAIADYKFFFVTDPATFDVVQRRYLSQIPGVEVILLG